jgi:hypothetical protein
VKIVMVIDGLFGPRSHDIDDERVGPQFQESVSTLLSLLDQVPTELIDFGIINLTELMRCRAVLTIAIGRWNQGAQVSAEAVNGKDPVERIKRLMQLCHDELPPPEPELNFINELSRLSIEAKMVTAWRNFYVQDWLGATTFAGAALEAVLLWALEKSNVMAENTKRNKAPNELHLPELIDEAERIKLLPADTILVARLAKDARNLIHAGRVARSGTPRTKASALTALAALYRVVEHLRGRSLDSSTSHG